MAFFPPDPPFPEYEEPERDPRWSPPDDEVAVAVGEPCVLARTEQLALVFRGADVYRDGVELRVDRVLRREETALEEWTTMTSLFMEHGVGGVGGRLRFGVVLPDGTAVLEGRPWDGADGGSTGPTLTRRGGGGGGGGRTYAGHDGLWLHPLPQDGPLELVFQWPDLGIAETHVVIELPGLTEAAERVIPVWGEAPPSR